MTTQPKISAWFQGAFGAFFEPEPHRSRRILTAVWLVGLYLLGGLWFGYFDSWGDHTLFFQDWADITGPRFQFLRDAAQTGQLPLHISDPSTMHGNTYRYLAVPDTLISPQYLLMKRFSVQRFQLINILIFYSLGFIGLLALGRKLRLSLFTFSLLFFLYNFNGNILAHLSVGHATWVGYFLFSWFVLLIFQLLEGDHSWRWCFQMSFLMFVIWLQGSFHQYLWLLLMLGLVGLCVPGKFWVMVRVGFFVLLMSAFRILPAILLYGRYGASYISGYPTLWLLWDSLVNLTNPLSIPVVTTGGEGLSAWETTNFIGLLATLWMLYFGLARGLFGKEAPARRLMLPLGGMLLLSVGQIFGFLRLLPIPMIQGERVGTRIISVVLVFLLVIAAERSQRWLDGVGERTFVQIGLTLGFAFTLMELWVNSGFWMISNGVKIFWWVYYDAHRWFVKDNYSDRTYLWLVFGGLALSLATIAGLGLAAWLERKRLKKSASLSG
jgi:hypothetical protein